jgi:hypothetical protein
VPGDWLEQGVSGHWTGGAANRRWVRSGNHNTYAPGDAERGRRLYTQMANVRFWCEVCGGCHPLREHRDCRRLAEA